MSKILVALLKHIILIYISLVFDAEQRSLENNQRPYPARSSTYTELLNSGLSNSVSILNQDHVRKHCLLPAI